MNMPQTDSYLKSSKDVFLEYSLDGVTWVDISGISNSISFSGGERASGDRYTFRGDTALVGAGKRAPIEATVSIVCDQSGAYATLRGYFRAGTWIYLRMTPAGDNPGNETWTSELGPITACPPPNQDAASGDPPTVEFTHRSADWTPSTLTT